MLFNSHAGSSRRLSRAVVQARGCKKPELREEVLGAHELKKPQWKEPGEEKSKSQKTRTLGAPGQHKGACHAAIQGVIHCAP